MRLLIEGGSYSRTAFIYSEGYLCADPVVSCCDGLVFQDYFLNRRVIMIEKQQQNQARAVCSVMLWHRTDDHLWRANVATPTLLCSRMRAATIRGRLLFGVRLLFDGICPAWLYGHKREIFYCAFLCLSPQGICTLF